MAQIILFIENFFQSLNNIIIWIWSKLIELFSFLWINLKLTLFPQYFVNVITKNKNNHVSVSAFNFNYNRLLKLNCRIGIENGKFKKIYVITKKKKKTSWFVPICTKENELQKKTSKSSAKKWLKYGWVQLFFSFFFWVLCFLT